MLKESKALSMAGVNGAASLKRCWPSCKRKGEGELMIIISVILQSFLLVSMTFGGGGRLAGAKSFVEMFESIELPQWFRVVTGLVQLTGAAGLVIGYWYPA